MWSRGTSAGSGTVPVLPVLPLLTRGRREGAMDPSPLGIPRCQSWKPSLGKSSGGRAIRISGTALPRNGLNYGRTGNLRFRVSRAPDLACLTFSEVFLQT